MNVFFANELTMILFWKILQPTLPVLYGISALWYLRYFFRKNTGYQKIATGTMITAAVCHMVYTVSLGIMTGRHPMATIFEFVSFVAMTMAFIYLFIERWHKNAYIGAFSVPAIFFLQFVSTMGIDNGVTLRPLLYEVRFAIHATAFAAAYASFFLGVIFALMIIMFERSLRRHRFGIIFEQLPSLDILAAMTASTLVVGFVLMSIGLGVGAYNALETTMEVGVDTKVYLSMLVWVIYGVAIATRFILHWSDKSLAVFSLWGFAMLVITTLATHVTDSSWHYFVG